MVNIENVVDYNKLGKEEKSKVYFDEFYNRLTKTFPDRKFVKGKIKFGGDSEDFSAKWKIKEKKRVFKKTVVEYDLDLISSYKKNPEIYFKTIDIVRELNKITGRQYRIRDKDKKYVHSHFPSI